VESPGINAYADGEYICALPAEISAVPGALHILRPKGGDPLRAATPRLRSPRT
jgi:diacylglycerol kinase family enzyme